MVVALATVAAVLFAGLAAWGALKAAEATRKAAESQLLLEFMREYADPRMARYLRFIALSQSAATATAAMMQEEWRKYFPDESPATHDARVDLARRYVRSYFDRAWRLYERRFISKDLLKSIIRVNGLAILLKYIEPLEAKRNERYDRTVFDGLRQAVGPDAVDTLEMT